LGWFHELEVLANTRNKVKRALGHIEPEYLVHVWALVTNNALIVTGWNLA
jgi:hypothetical protein